MADFRDCTIARLVNASNSKWRQLLLLKVFKKTRCNIIIFNNRFRIKPKEKCRIIYANVCMLII